MKASVIISPLVTLVSLIFLMITSAAQADTNPNIFFKDLNFEKAPVSENNSLKLRIGVYNPSTAIVGDIIYIHGFADRLDNHAPLFKEWTDAGLRVIAFDLPSHGENSGRYNNLNKFSFEDLTKLAAQVEMITLTDSTRPLILAGWSTGGLVVVRALQDGWNRYFSRPVAGAILFAPGVSVRKFPWTFGNRLGMVTEKSLTHNPNPPHVGPISPSTPFWSNLVFNFAPSLLYNSFLSQNATYPSDIKTLMFIGGDSEDVYAKSGVLKEWLNEQNENRESNKIIGIKCPHGRHELDNESNEYGGNDVRTLSAKFASAVVTGRPTEDLAQGMTASVCKIMSKF